MKNKEEKPKENRIEAQKTEEQEPVKEDVNQQKTEKEKIEVSNFEEVKRKIHECIIMKDIKKAIEIAKKALEQGELENKEKRKLQELVDLVEIVGKREIYKRSDRDESR